MRLAAVSLLLFACSSSGGEALPEVDGGTTGGTVSFRLLQANVGNVDFGCKAYVYKLCDYATEQRVAQSIAKLAPDVVVLEEVVADGQCALMPAETDPAKVCHPSHPGTQVQRLLGDAFDVACATRNGYECVAVRKTFGTLENMDTLDATPGCNAGFTMSHVRVLPKSGNPFYVVDGHPPSGPLAIDCRADQIRRELSRVPAPALVAGDMNMDPYSEDDASTTAWKDFVGDGKRFHYHSKNEPTGFTVISAKALDHVASDFAAGTCTVLTDAQRLDQGSGCDHRALSCQLSY